MTDSPATTNRWDALRGCWLDLQNPQPHQFAGTGFYRDLEKRQADAFAALISSGDLETDVADRLQMAFVEAIAHVQKHFVRCYIALPAEFETRENLTTQAAALAEMAQRGNIDPATIAKAQDSLAREIAWLAQFEAGQQPWKQETIAASPAEIEAARILADLLSGRM